jgi:hypothetical protein
MCYEKNRKFEEDNITHNKENNESRITVTVVSKISPSHILVISHYFNANNNININRSKKSKLPVKIYHF